MRCRALSLTDLALEYLHIQRCSIPIPLSSTQRKQLHLFRCIHRSYRSCGLLESCQNWGTIACWIWQSQYWPLVLPTPFHGLALQSCAGCLTIWADQRRDWHWGRLCKVLHVTIVRGYINKSTRYFIHYMWPVVLCTDLNPADHVARSIPAAQLQHSNWFSFPAFLHWNKTVETPDSNVFTLIGAEAYDEIRSEVRTLATEASESYSCSQHSVKP